MPSNMSTDLSHPLLQESKSCILEAQTIQSKADREKRDLTAAESDKITGLLDDAKQARAKWGDEPQPSIVRRPDLGHGGPQPSFRPPAGGVVRGTGGGYGAELFGDCRGATDGFSSPGDWLGTIASGLNDNRLMAANQGGVDSEGGFLAPQQYATGFFDAMIESAVLLPKVARLKMTSDTLHLNSPDGNDHSSSLFGGLDIGWEPELGSLTGQTAKFRRVSFHAKKAVILNQSSNEILTDGQDFERLMNESLATTMAFKLDSAIINGLGGGQPLGIIAANSTIQVDKVAAQTAETVWFRNVVTMMSRLAPGCWQGAVWMAHPSVVTQLFAMDSHADLGSGSSLIGDTVYMPFKETNGSFSLMGRPCYITEKCQPLGTAGDLILCDPSQYAMAFRQELVIDKSVHAGFSTDSVYFRAKIRVDGQPLWASAMTPANGSDTLSWAVILQTRE